MIYPLTKTLATALLLTGAALSAGAQAFAPVENPWYIGAQGGTSFGQCTSRSITEHRIHWGAQGGLFGGYRLNRLLSLEAALQYGAQTQSVLDCCTYWLAEDGTRYLNPVLDRTGWFYHDITTRTGWGKLSLQANADLLSLFTAPVCRWSLNLGPQISAVTTKTRLITPDKTIGYDRQWHLGLGGQASVGYRITKRLGVSLYGGITCLTGERFDNLPRHAHKSNLIWDAGVKVAVSLGAARSGREPDIPDTGLTSADEEARLAAEKAEQERLAAEEAARLEREKAERERMERERLEQERMERERLEREAAEKEAAFHTPIPNVYFANNSAAIERKSNASLEEALAILDKYPDFNLEIHAYCSNSGSKAYNEKLSEQRMEAVRGWFAAHGIAPERMGKAYFHGIDYNALSADEARRAELWFVK